MQIQNHDNNNTFQGIKLGKIDTDHAKKFLEPALDGLRGIAEYCDIYVSDSSIPIKQMGNAIIGEPAIKLTVTPLKGDKLIFFLKNIFRGNPKKVSTQVAVNSLRNDKNAELLPAAAKAAAEDLYGSELLSLLS